MKKILIIEDTKSFAGILEFAIKDTHGFETVVAADFKSAQNILEQHADDFFLAIIDLNLPDAPNGEAVGMVLQHKIAGIVFTGQLSDALREDMIAAGVTDYVCKQGQHNIEYVVAQTKRIYRNFNTKVLVVDDSRVARGVMRKLLNIQRYQVLEAERDMANRDCLSACCYSFASTESKVLLMISDVKHCTFSAKFFVLCCRVTAALL